MDPEKPDTAAQEVLAEAQRISPNPTENQKTEAKIEAAITQESEDALLEEEEQSALHNNHAESVQKIEASTTQNNTTSNEVTALETGTENPQTFINDADSDLTSDSDDEPDVITNTVNLFPANNNNLVAGKPGENKGNVAVPRDIGTVVKPTAGETPEVKVQGDSQFTVYFFRGFKS